MSTCSWSWDNAASEHLGFIWRLVKFISFVSSLSQFLSLFPPLPPSPSPSPLSHSLSYPLSLSLFPCRRAADVLGGGAPGLQGVMCVERVLEAREAGRTPPAGSSPRRPCIWGGRVGSARLFATRAAAGAGIGEDGAWAGPRKASRQQHGMAWTGSEPEKPKPEARAPRGDGGSGRAQTR